jgi:Ca2+-binding EF-hand superfamily protein
MSLDQFHAELDKNKDGNIDFSEFVDGLTSKAIGTLNREDLETIFKVIDINEDKTLSVNEISLFI